MRDNPGKVMTIYDIPSIVAYSFDLAITPQNILGGFKKTGIWPFDREGFHARADYAPGYVTDRPDPTEEEAIIATINLPADGESIEIPPEIAHLLVEGQLVESGRLYNKYKLL